MFESKYRLVFLVEESQFQCDEGYTVLKHVELLVLRLLNYYRLRSNSVSEDFLLTNVLTDTLWSYKFYNARFNRLEYNSHNFYDVNTSSYNNFIDQVKDRISCSRNEEVETKGPVGVCLSGNGKKGKGSELTRFTEESNFKCSGTELIRKALNELITDFPWDRPDLTSPDKIKKPLKAEAASRATNCVFHISPCIYCLKRQYFGNSLPSSVAALEKLLIPKDFRSIPNSKLYWISTGSSVDSLCNVLPEHTNEESSLHILLSLYSGTLISITAISSYGNVRRIKKNSISKHNARRQSALQSCKIIPLSSVIDFLLTPKLDEKEPVTSRQQVVSLEFEKPQNESKQMNLAFLESCTIDKAAISYYGSPVQDLLTKRISLVGYIDYSYAGRLITCRSSAFHCIPAKTIDFSGHDEVDNIIVHAQQEKLVLVSRVQFHGESTSDGIALLQPWTTKEWMIYIARLSSTDLCLLESKITPLFQDSSSGKNSSQEDCKGDGPGTSVKPSFPTDCPFIESLEPWFLHHPQLGVKADILTRIERPEQVKNSNGKNEYKKTLVLGKLKDLYYLKKPLQDIALWKAKVPSCSLATVASAPAKHLMLKNAPVQQESRCKTTNNSALHNKEQETADDLLGITSIASAKNIEELTSAVVEAVESSLHQEMNNIPEAARCIVSSIALFFQGEQRHQIEPFLREHLLIPAIKLKGMALEGRPESTKWHLLAIYFWFEVNFILPDPKTAQDAEHEVVKMLQSLSFLESPEFVVILVRLSLYKRYCTSAQRLLKALFDGLMLERPEALLTPSKESPKSIGTDEAEDSPFLGSSVEDAAFMNPRRKLIRRYSSIGAGSALRREISVPVKKESKRALSRQMTAPSGQLSKPPLSPHRRRVCRDIFEREDFQGQLKTPEKMAGSYSTEVSVKNTPVYKQKRKLVWKLQERERRRSQVGKEKTVVQESPLKGENSKSNSQEMSSQMSYGRSTKRFYRLRRLPSYLNSLSAPEKRCIYRLEYEDTASEHETESTEKCASEDSGTHSSSSLSQIEGSKLTGSFSSSDLIPGEPKRKLDFVSPESRSSRAEMFERSTFHSEDSMDWIAMVEQDEQYASARPGPDVNFETISCDEEKRDDHSPIEYRVPYFSTVKPMEKLENGTSCKTPTQSPQLRELFIPSPRLSASSLEVLEHAPILSPELLNGKRKTISGRPFTSSRKGKRGKELSESPVPVEKPVS